MSPGRILLFLVIVALSLTAIALLFPQDGIHLGKQLELRFVSKEELLAQKEKWWWILPTPSTWQIRSKP